MATYYQRVLLVPLPPLPVPLLWLILTLLPPQLLLIIQLTYTTDSTAEYHSKNYYYYYNYYYSSITITLPWSGDPSGAQQVRVHFLLKKEGEVFPPFAVPLTRKSMDYFNNKKGSKTTKSHSFIREKYNELRNYYLVLDISARVDQLSVVAMTIMP